MSKRDTSGYGRNVGYPATSHRSGYYPLQVMSAFAGKSRILMLPKKTEPVH